MTVEQVEQAPDADPVAILTLRHGCHVLIEGGVRRRGAETRSMMRFTRRKILRPHFPRHDESDRDLGLVRPLDRFWSWHGSALNGKFPRGVHSRLAARWQIRAGDRRAIATPFRARKFSAGAR